MTKVLKFAIKRTFDEHLKHEHGPFYQGWCDRKPLTAPDKREVKLKAQYKVMCHAEGANATASIHNESTRLSKWILTLVNTRSE